MINNLPDNQVIKKKSKIKRHFALQNHAFFEARSYLQLKE
jgi:hypothetical protein